MATRLDKAINCWKTHQSAKIIVSGGIVQKAKESEAEVMAAYLIAHGIPARKIIRENKALNTWQNLAFASHLIKPQETVVVVTSDFHVIRARAYARKMGLNWSFISSKTALAILSINFYSGLSWDYP